MQTEKQHRQRVALRFVEYRQEIGAAHEHQSSSVIHHVEEVDGRGQHTTQDQHQHGEFLVHSLEQTVKSQREEDQYNAAEQIGNDAETEEQLVRGNVAGRRG